MRALLLSCALGLAVPSKRDGSPRAARNILIFGPPGVGKSTHSQRLATRYGVCHVSTGELLRAEVARGTALGKRAQAAIARGGLVPDRVVMRLVRQRLRSDRGCRRRGWLLDGFPRTAQQAHKLIGSGLVPNQIIVLNASSDELVARIRARASEASRRGEAPRPDDEPATVRRRFDEYEKHKRETLAALRRYLRVADIDAGGTQEAVASDIGRVVEAIHANRL